MQFAITERVAGECVLRSNRRPLLLLGLAGGCKCDLSQTWLCTLEKITVLKVLLPKVDLELDPL